MVKKSQSQDTVNLNEMVLHHCLHTVVAAKNGRRCIDGRYKLDEHSGTIARPGGDFGYVMALLAVISQFGLNLKPEDCFERIYEVIIAENNAVFSMHSDNANELSRLNRSARDESEHPIIGCGHIANAMLKSNAFRYGLFTQDVVSALNYARKKKSKGGRIDIDILDGVHAEAAVLVVKGKRTIQPWLDDKMFYVYDVERDRVFMEDLVRKLKIPGVTPERFIHASTQQLRETLRLMASRKPIFEICVDKAKPRVRNAGLIV